jgi:hypothetical protein
MEPVRKQLACPACGQIAEVRILPGAEHHRWHCPHCHKLQTTDKATADAAAPAS